VQLSRLASGCGQMIQAALGITLVSDALICGRVASRAQSVVIIPPRQAARKSRKPFAAWLVPAVGSSLHSARGRTSRGGKTGRRLTACLLDLMLFEAFRPWVAISRKYQEPRQARLPYYLVLPRWLFQIPLSAFLRHRGRVSTLATSRVLSKHRTV
jgi:hypothetical protein